MAEVNERVLVEASLLMLLLLQKQIYWFKRRQHPFWVREIFQRRNKYGVFYMQELGMERVNTFSGEYVQILLRLN